jgi:adenosylmethionine-8-amino-7-oxononanoate aminotransferase
MHSLRTDATDSRQRITTADTASSQAEAVIHAADDIVASDTKHVLHGFAPLRRGDAPGPIFRSARGIRMTDVYGNEWLDACAGLANINLGYGREDLAEVASAAMRELSFGTTFYHSRSHIPAAQLAERLATITPRGIEQFFYALGGSDAVETAIKIARYVHAMNGRPERFHIIGRVRSYHGVTYGALSLSGDPEMARGAGPLLEGFSRIEQPRTDRAGEAQALEEEILRVGPERVAAFMAEPISTPNGIKPPAADYWPQIREICDRYGVLLIADEVLTGFGRAGRMFAIETWDVAPDILTMSKAITNGVFPLSVVGFTNELMDRLSDEGSPFLHGVTSSGHPTACAVAMETINIMEREGVVEHGAEMGRLLLDRIHTMADRRPSVLRSSIRGAGLMVAFDFDTANVGEELGRVAHDRFIADRLFVRHYLDQQTVGFMPALTCTAQDVEEIVERTAATIERVEADLF